MESADEVQFLQRTAAGCLFKIELGIIADRQAAAQEVRAFGKRMSARYAEMLLLVKALAQKKRIPLPQGPDAAVQNTVSYFLTLHGAGLDREYVSLAADDLSDDAARFKRAATAAPDQEVRDFAQTSLNMLKADLEAAEKLCKELPLPVLK